MVVVAVLGQVAVSVVDRHRLVGRGAESGEPGEARVVPAEEVSAIFGVLMPLGAAVIAASCRAGPGSQQLVKSVSGLVAAVGLPLAVDAALGEFWRVEMQRLATLVVRKSWIELDLYRC